MGKTAEELLKIIKGNYSEYSYAFGDWSEAEIEIPTELGEKEQKAKDKFYEENLKGLTYDQQKESPYLEVYQNMPSKYDIIDLYVLNELGLGEVVSVHQRGGEGQGTKWYQVWYFKDHDVYLRIDGHYTSYNGVDFYDGFGYQVFPKEKTITIYT